MWKHISKWDDVSDAIMMLDDNSICGLDIAEHLQNASNRLFLLLGRFFAGFIVHNILPDSVFSLLLEPVIKDKASKFML